jgi:hypothetical protein
LNPTKLNAADVPTLWGSRSGSSRCVTALPYACGFAVPVIRAEAAIMPQMRTWSLARSSAG